MFIFLPMLLFSFGSFAARSHDVAFLCAAGVPLLSWACLLKTKGELSTYEKKV
jgi:hypothetical protein